MTTLAEKSVKGLLGLIHEIEELQVQSALGKAEARNQFENAKKKFSHFIAELKAGFHAAEKNVGESSEELFNILKKIESSLDEIIHDSESEIEKQKKNLDELATELDKQLSAEKSKSPISETASNQIEKFRLKLEILKLQLALKQTENEKDLADAKKKYRNQWEAISQQFHALEKNAGHDWNVFKKDVERAYSELKGAF